MPFSAFACLVHVTTFVVPFKTIIDMKTTIVPVTKFLPFLIVWAIFAMPVFGKPGKNPKNQKDEQAVNGKKQIPQVTGAVKKGTKGKMVDPNLSNGWTQDPGYGW